MIINQSQFYDIVQYGESRGLDPKIFTHQIVEIKKVKTIFGFTMNQKLTRPYSLIGISGKDYYFHCTVHYNNTTENNYTYLDKIYWLGGEKEDTSKYDYEVKINLSPGKNMLAENYRARGRRKNFGWNHLFGWGKFWVNNLVDEIHAIESLERINSIPSFFSESRTFDYYGGAYSQKENTIIKEKIHLLKSAIIEEIPLTENQFNIINDKLDDLSIRVDMLSKFDFRTLFFGILTNIASSVIYDNAPKFWTIVRNIFGGSMLDNGGTDLLI